MQRPLIITGNAEVVSELKRLGADAVHAKRIATTLIGQHAQRTMKAKLPSRFAMRGTAAAFERAIIWQAPRETATRKVQGILKVGSDTGGTKATGTRNLGRILARHEEADTRTESNQVFFNGQGKAMTGLGFFVPANGLRTSTSNPPRRYYPANIGAAMRLDAGGKLILANGTKKGSKKRGTGESFFATRQGIFRRRHTGFGGRVQVEAVWWFVGRIRTPARLRLWETVEEVFDRFAVAYTIDAIDTVLARTSPKGLA